VVAGCVGVTAAGSPPPVQICLCVLLLVFIGISASKHSRAAAASDARGAAAGGGGARYTGPVCARGQFVDVHDSRICVDCPAGRAGHPDGHSACGVCGAGSYAPSAARHCVRGLPDEITENMIANGWDSPYVSAQCSVPALVGALRGGARGPRPPARQPLRTLPRRLLLPAGRHCLPGLPARHGGRRRRRRDAVPPLRPGAVREAPDDHRRRRRRRRRGRGGGGDDGGGARLRRLCEGAPRPRRARRDAVRGQPRGKMILMRP
jgi:hypothetical protein